MSRKRQYLIYVAGPYTAASKAAIDANIRRAEAAAIELLRAGYAVLCPHKNTAHLDNVMPWEDFMEMSMTQIERCDAVLFIEGWEHSRGCCMERDFCMNEGIPFFDSMAELEAYFNTEPLPLHKYDLDQ